MSGVMVHVYRDRNQSAESRHFVISSETNVRIIKKMWSKTHERAWCSVHSRAGWFCSRKIGHEGPHVACNELRVCAMWPQKPGDDEEASVRRLSHRKRATDRFFEELLK